eukprot:COSAG01_NODE_911_length_12783_cov_145.960817_10_plen_291_part_00
MAAWHRLLLRLLLLPSKKAPCGSCAPLEMDSPVFDALASPGVAGGRDKQAVTLRTPAPTGPRRTLRLQSPTASSGTNDEESIGNATVTPQTQPVPAQPPAQRSVPPLLLARSLASPTTEGLLPLRTALAGSQLSPRSVPRRRAATPPRRPRPTDEHSTLPPFVLAELWRGTVPTGAAAGFGAGHAAGSGGGGGDDEDEDAWRVAARLVHARSLAARLRAHNAGAISRAGTVARHEMPSVPFAGRGDVAAAVHTSALAAQKLVEQQRSQESSAQAGCKARCAPVYAPARRC